MEWYPTYGSKCLFKFGEKDQLRAVATHERVLLKIVAMAISHSLLKQSF